MVKMRQFNKNIKRLKEYNSNVIIGLKYFFDAHEFVLKNKLIGYLLISGLFFLSVFSVSMQALLNGIESVEPWLTNLILDNFKSYINLEVATIKKGIQASFWLLKMVIESNKDGIFITVFLVVGTPYFSFVSEKIHKILTSETRPFSLRTWWKEIKRGLRLSLINTFKQLAFLLIITLISFIPVVGIVAPLLTFIVQAYYNGILMTDYSLEREGYDLKNTEIFYSQNKAIMFSVGLGFMFLLLIPVIGWFLAPTYALTASILFFHKQYKQVEIS